MNSPDTPAPATTTRNSRSAITRHTPNPTRASRDSMLPAAHSATQRRDPPLTERLLCTGSASAPIRMIMRAIAPQQSQRVANQASLVAAYLILRLKGVIATWRYDRSGYIISLNASRHLYKPLSRAGRGFEGPIFNNSPTQCGVEPRDIYEPNFTSRHSERVKCPQRRLGTVPFNYFREGRLSPVLPIELSRALRPP